MPMSVITLALLGFLFFRRQRMKRTSEFNTEVQQLESLPLSNGYVQGGHTSLGEQGAMTDLLDLIENMLL